jgi:hypothetical protein
MESVSYLNIQLFASSSFHFTTFSMKYTSIELIDKLSNKSYETTNY